MTSDILFQVEDCRLSAGVINSDVPCYVVEQIERGAWVVIGQSLDREHLKFWAECIGPEMPAAFLSRLSDIPKKPARPKSQMGKPKADLGKLRAVLFHGPSGERAMRRKATYAQALMPERDERFVLCSDKYHGVLLTGKDADGKPVRLSVSPNGTRYHVQRFVGGRWTQNGRKGLNRWRPEIDQIFGVRSLSKLPVNPLDVKRPWAAEMERVSNFLKTAAPNRDDYSRVVVSDLDWRFVVCPLGLEFFLQQKKGSEWATRRRGPSKASILQGLVDDASASGWPADVTGWVVESAILRDAVRSAPDDPSVFGPLTLENGA